MAAIAEVALLASAFPDDLVFIDEGSERAVEQYLEDTSSERESEVGRLSFAMALSRGCSMKVVLPTGYPEIRPSISLVDVNSKANHDEINNELSLYLQSTSQGDAFLSDLKVNLTLFIEDLYARQDGIGAGMEHSEPEESQGSSDQIIVRQGTASSVHGNKSSFSRILFYAHHLLAESKRKDIKSLSESLSLYTISRTGYPGLIAAEGATEAINTFVKRIKQMRWAVIKLQYEHVIPLEAEADWQAHSILAKNFNNSRGSYEVKTIADLVALTSEDDAWLGSLFR